MTKQGGADASTLEAHEAHAGTGLIHWLDRPRGNEMENKPVQFASWQRWCLVAGSVMYGVLPVFADVNASHLFNPDWSPHARLHGVWLLVLTTLLGLVNLVLLLRRPGAETLRRAAVTGLAVAGSFLLAALLADLYGGALHDRGQDVPLAVGVNLMLFALVAGLMLAGYPYHGLSGGPHDGPPGQPRGKKASTPED